MEIKVRKLTEEEINKKGITKWPIWEKEASSFDWYYSENEDCLILEGDIEVETSDGNKVEIHQGDFVTFPKGLKCRWNIKKAVRKHYNFG